MATTQTQTGLIDSTVEAFNGEITSVSAMDGISMIDNWVTVLRSGDESTNPVASTLSALKLQLQAGNPDTAQIDALLAELADQAEGFVGKAEDDKVNARLRELAGALRGFGDTLAGRNGRVEGGRGQIFTQTHTGSATGNAGAPEMGRQDGSPGDEDTEGHQGGGSYGSGYGTGSDTEEGSENSGTDPRTPGTSVHEGGSKQ